MYSHSLKWVSPQVKDKEQHKYLNKARNTICPESDVFTINFNISEHRQAYEKLVHEREQKRQTEHQDGSSVIPSRSAMSSMTYPTPNHYTTPHSTVLSWPTIFVPASDNRNHSPADWPCKEEMDYEGDSRIKTEKLHSRMMPTPRVNGNETVAWSHKTFITPLALDDFRPSFDEISIFMRSHSIDDCEPTDEEGLEILGSELMDLLDPVDRW